MLIALAYVYQGPLKEWRENSGKPDNFLANIEFAAVTAVEITRGGDTTILVKQGDKWKIGDAKEFYIKDNVALNLEEAIGNAIKAEVELVSSNKDKKSEFNTDKANGIYVILKQGNQVLGDFVVGKLASDFFSTYISRPGMDATYALKENIYSALARDDWHDRTIFSSVKDKIDVVRFQYPDREFTIERQGTSTDAEWAGTLPYAFRADKDKVDVVLNIMSNLTAAEIPEQTFAGTGLEKHSAIVQATGEGIDNVLMVGGSNVTPEEVEEGEGVLYYAKKGDSDNIYLITKEQRDELDKRIRDLR